jgi:hypothetical protein
MDNFFRTGEFNPPDNRLPEYEKFEYIELPRRPYSLINMTFWFLLICGPLAYYITGMLLSGDWTLITIAFVLVLLAYVGMERLINLTKISKGSNYGENTNGVKSKMNGVNGSGVNGTGVNGTGVNGTGVNGTGVNGNGISNGIGNGDSSHANNKKEH